MPIIIATSYNQNGLSEIAFLDAGDPVIAVCDLGGTLEATVVGDLLGHSLLWEQISGSPVTFTSPVNELSVTYTVTDFDDKVFRFTIDKGFPQELHDDVDVFGAPTQQLPVQPATSAVRTNITSFGVTEHQTHRIRAELLPADVLSPPAILPVIHCRTIDTPILQWPALVTTETVVRYEVLVLSSTGWTLIETLPPTARISSVLTIPDSFHRVDTIYANGSGEYAISSEPVLFTNDELPFVYITDGCRHPSTPTSQRANLLKSRDVLSIALVVKPPVEEALIQQPTTQSAPRTNVLAAHDVLNVSLTAKDPVSNSTTVPVATSSNRTNLLVAHDVITLSSSVLG